METIKEIAALREVINTAKAGGKCIGLVPTMGYLHEGHLSLIKQAGSESDLVVVSIFVNPIQFGPNEDYTAYPRDLARDSELAFAAGADIIFAPTVEEMYPQPQLTHVDVASLGQWLCGHSRPGHFQGVSTVVSKLFNLVQPDKAYFGAKDAQQLAIIKRMVADLNFPIEIVSVPIVREYDGLALSSRNVYLTSEERSQATVLYQALLLAKDMFAKGERNSARLVAAITATINQKPAASIDYVEITDTTSLQPVVEIGSEALIALAVRFGKTRLIDNICLQEV